MNFAEILRILADECGGGIGAALLGSDGIPIEQVQATVLPAGVVTDAEALDEDLGAIGVEFGRVMDEARKASDSVSGGHVEEMLVQTARYWILLRSVDEDAFLALAMIPEGNVGKARFLMRRHLLALREQL
jgi:predicted regulator of Ras-like GTPase activity (Roadblock/LC7/MglB family)